MNREEVQTTPGYSAHGKGAALGRGLLTLLQLPYNSSSEISSHHQYVGSQLEILTSLGSCYSRQEPALGLGVPGPLCSPRPPRRHRASLRPRHAQPLTGTQETLPPLLLLATPTRDFQTSIRTVQQTPIGPPPLQRVHAFPGLLLCPRSSNFQDVYEYLQNAG